MWVRYAPAAPSSSRPLTLSVVLTRGEQRLPRTLRQLAAAARSAPPLLPRHRHACCLLLPSLSSGLPSGPHSLAPTPPLRPPAQCVVHKAPSPPCSRPWTIDPAAVGCSYVRARAARLFVEPHRRHSHTTSVSPHVLDRPPSLIAAPLLAAKGPARGAHRPQPASVCPSLRLAPTHRSNPPLQNSNSPLRCHRSAPRPAAAYGATRRGPAEKPPGPRPCPLLASRPSVPNPRSSRSPSKPPRCAPNRRSVRRRLALRGARLTGSRRCGRWWAGWA